MIPESKLIKSEITIRELSLPDDVVLARKSLIRWLALSLGLITPNESRRLLLDVFETLLDFHVKGDSPTTKDILDRLESETKAEQNPKAVYYHLLRLKEFGIISRKKGRYQIGNGNGQKLSELFRDFYLQKTNQAFDNIETALNKLESKY